MCATLRRLASTPLLFALCLTLVLLLASGLLGTAVAWAGDNEAEGPSTVSATPSAGISGYSVRIDTNQDGIPDTVKPISSAGALNVTLSWDEGLRADGYHIYLDSELIGSTTNTSYATSVAEGEHLFRVAGYNDYGEADGATVELDYLDEVIDLPNDVRHTSFALGDWNGHGTAAQIDTKSLTLSVCDLAIASCGPSAELARHYDSDRSSAGYFAAGWRFSFERNLAIAAETVTYTDEAGDAHIFTKVDSSWVAANGYDGTLAHPDTTWTLTFLDKNVLTFDSGGRLIKERDANLDGQGAPANEVTYGWSSGVPASITAANGQQIILTVVAGKLTSASYTVTIGCYEKTRRVAFTNGSTPTATYSYLIEDEGDPATPARTISYTYTNNRITAISALDWPTSSQSVAEVPIYNGSGDLTGLQYPDYAACGDAYATIAYPAAGQATLTRHGKLNDQAGQSLQVESVGLDTDTGATTELIVSGEEQTKTTYTYTDELQIDAETITDNSGGEEQGEEISFTDYVYDPLQPARMTRSIAESETGDGTSVEQTDFTENMAVDTAQTSNDQQQTLASTVCSGYQSAHPTLPTIISSAQGSATAQTLLTYDDHGRTTSERRLVSGTPENGTWVETTYESFADNGQPQTTTHKAVKLSVSASPADRIETATYDAFGNLTARTNTAGETIETNSYDLAGRLLSSTDAAGIVTHHSYDCLGYETATWRTASGTSMKADWKTFVCDALGRVTAETTLLWDSEHPEGRTAKTRTTTYDGFGHEIEATDSTLAGQKERWIYNADGNIASHWALGVAAYDETRATRTTYTPQERVYQEYAPGDTSPTTYTYDVQGRITKETAPDGSWTSYTYDAAGNVLTETRPRDGYLGDSQKVLVTTKTYLIGGLLHTLKGPNDLTTTYGYDLLGRQTSAGGGQAQSSLVEYNSLGWVLQRVEADDTATRTVYDAAGRTTSTTQGSWNRSTSTFTASQDPTALTYDQGRLSTQTDADDKQLTYDYDAFGNRFYELHENAAQQTIKEIETTFDSLGRPLSREDAISGLARSWSYPLNTAAGIAESEGYGAIATEIARSTRNLETTRTTTLAAGDTLTRSVSTRDTADRWTSASIGNATAGRSFTGKGQLASQSGDGFASTATYTYDDDESGKKVAQSLPLELGGTLAGGYTYDNAGRLESSDGPGGLASTTFDAANNLTGFVDAGGTATLSYNTANQLTQMSYCGITTNYGWDAATGRRAWQGKQTDTSIIRHNQMPNPSFETDSNSDGRADGVSDWGSDIAGSATYTRPAGQSGSYAQRIAYTGLGGDSDATLAVNLDFTGDDRCHFGTGGAGDLATASLSVKGSLPEGNGAYLVLDVYDADGDFLTNQDVEFTPSETWQRISVSRESLPATAASWGAVLYFTGIDPTEVLDVSLDAVLYEINFGLGAYFDGASSGAAWDGAAHASASTLSEAGPTERHNLLRDPSLESDADEDGLADAIHVWNDLAGEPDYSRPAGRLSGAAQQISYTGQSGENGEANWLIDGGEIAVTELEPITFSAYLTGANAGIDVNLLLIYFDANEEWVNDAWSNDITLTGSFARHVVRGVVPSGAVTMRAIVYAGDVENGEELTLTFDDCLAEKSGTLHDYFDGQSANAAWDGVANASSSTLDLDGPSIEYAGYTATGRLSHFEDHAAHIDATYAYDAAGQRRRSVVSDYGTTTATSYVYDGLTLLSLRAAVGDDRHNLFTQPGFERDGNDDGLADGVGDWGSIAYGPSYQRPEGLTGRAQQISYGGDGSDDDADYECSLGCSEGGSVTPGQPLRGSLYVKGTLSGEQTVRLRLHYHDGEDNWLSADSKYFTITETWQRVSLGRLTAPANASYAFLTILVEGIDDGESFELLLDDHLLEQSTTTNSYFDGDAAGAEWDGEPHQSTSTLAAAAPADRHNLLTNPGCERDADSDGLADSWDVWGSIAGTPTTTLGGGAHGGQYAQRLAYSGLGSDSDETFEPQVTTAPGSFAADNRYTFSVHAKGSLVGTGTPYIGVVALDGDDEIIDDTYTEIELSGAWQRFAISGSCPTGTTHLRCYLWLDGVDVGDTIELYIDDTLLEKSSSLRAYFDGDSENASWDGTAHASSSTCEAATAAEHESWQIDYLYDEEGVPYGGVYRSPANSRSPLYFSMIATDRGDVVELLDRDGDAFAAYRYDEWGNPIGAGSLATGIWTDDTNLVSSALAGQIATRQVLRYAGYCFDTESGLYYCSARYFDPYSRQWTTKDEVKADGEESAYQYCGGEPVGQVDPSGFAGGSAVFDSQSYWREQVNRWKKMLEGGPRWGWHTLMTRRMSIWKGKQVSTILEHTGVTLDSAAMAGLESVVGFEVAAAIAYFNGYLGSVQYALDRAVSDKQQAHSRRPLIWRMQCFWPIVTMRLKIDRHGTASFPFLF
jgi:RHS repeat-associated protein